MTDPAVMEHIFWCCDHGQSPAEVLLSVGSILPSHRPADWHDVAMVLSMVWRRMQEQMADRQWRTAA